MDNLGSYVREMQKDSPSSLPVKKRCYDHAAGRTPEVLAQENRAKETNHSVESRLRVPEKGLDCSIVTRQGFSHGFSVVESNFITGKRLNQGEGNSKVEEGETYDGSTSRKRPRSVQERLEYPDVQRGKNSENSQNLEKFVYLENNEGIAQWIHDNKIDHVIVQGDYMSGDRYIIGIATALIGKEKYGTLIIANNKSIVNNAKELVHFYNTLLSVHGKQKEQQNRIAIYNIGESSEEDVRKAYKSFRDNPSYFGDTCVVSGPTHVTSMVAKILKGLGGRRDHSTYLVDKLMSGISGNDKRLFTEAIIKYFKECLPYSSKYAFIWSKAADSTHAHFNHSLPSEGLAAIVEVAKAANRHPVLVGDKPDDWNSHRIPGVTELWDFWNDEKFPESLKEKGRVGQLIFFRYLAISDKWDVVNIGMRAGNLEGAALFGMPTIYMEEKSIDSAKRLECLLPHMKNFCRLIIDKSVGEERKKKLAQDFKMLYKQVESEDKYKIEKFKQAMLNINDKLPRHSKTLLYIFHYFKLKYMQEILKHINSLMQHQEQEQPFTSEELETMKQMLTFSGADIKDGKRINDWRVGLRNKSIAESLCEGELRNEINKIGASMPNKQMSDKEILHWLEHLTNPSQEVPVTLTSEAELLAT